MQERPEAPRRRRRGSRGRGGAREQRPPLPTRAPARPLAPRERQRDRAQAQAQPPATQRRRRAPSPGAGDDIKRGTVCVIVLDCREGEPDRTGEKALFEGYFDFETGDPRRQGAGIPRLRIGDERLWGFECWWRPDPAGEGLTERDREDVETAKRMLRGLLRDARRSGRPPMAAVSAPRPG